MNKIEAEAWRDMGRWITGETDTKPELYYDDGNNTDPGVDVHGAPRDTELAILD